MLKLSELFRNETNSRRSWVKSFFIMVLGAVIASFALHVFFFPNRLIMGGISGVASLILYITGWNLPFGTFMIGMNIPIFLLGYFRVSRSFFVQSVIGTIVFGVVTDLTSPVFEPLSRFLFEHSEITDQVILSTIAGGTLFGLGLGMIFIAGYTSGGTDILAILLRKKLHFISLGQMIWLFDAIIIACTAIAYYQEDPGMVRLALWSSLAVYLTSRAMDGVIEGFNYKKVSFIISDHSEDIAAAILSSMDRGVTGIKSVGMFTNQDRLMLVCVLMKKEIPFLKNLAVTKDPNSFIFVLDSREVLGEGFEGSEILM